MDPTSVGIRKRMPTGTFKAVRDEDIDNLLAAATQETPARQRLKTSEVQLVPRNTQPPTPPALRPITELVHSYGEQLAEHQRTMYAAMNLLSHRLQETEDGLMGQVATMIDALKQTNALLEHNNNLQAHVYQTTQGSANAFNEMTQHWRETARLNKRVLQSKVTRTLKRVYKDPSQTLIGAVAGILTSAVFYAVFVLITH